MTPINPHALNVSLVALPMAMAAARKLLQDRKSPVPAAGEASADAMSQVERRAKTMTEALKKIVGHPHHGINE
jgi:NAD kinase